jgi:L-threonylcarbamoyladenylate synthase
MQHQVIATTIPVWKIDSPQLEADAIARAADVVRTGGIIIYPTETLYGLGGDPMCEAAIERIYRIKGRDFKKPLPLVAADIEAVRKVAAQWPRAAERLARAFWPGPLTLILPSTPVVPPRLHAYTGRVAVRVSSHPIANRLAAAVGGLLISTSANIAGQASYTNSKEIGPEFLSRVDGLIDGGGLTGDLPSTIVDLSFDPPRPVRAGCVSWESIRRLLAFGS